MNINPSNLKHIFEQALEIDSTEARITFLDQACAGNEQLRAEVEALLQSSDTSFLERPAVMLHETNEMSEKEAVGTVIGRYKLLQEIGEGGFGIVYMAEQLEPVTRKVALKVIKPGMDTRQVMARFEAERQALALMDHPNIARVLDGGSTQSGKPYFVMELVRGVPITKYCDQNGLTIRERLELFTTVCQAVQHAHQKGIIHRDIKPGNVMVTLHDGQPVSKVIDFGVAKVIHQRLTDRTLFTNYFQILGTPLYMSPEQAEMSGLDVDTRTDIYSLGVLLYELLTGTTPIERNRLRVAAHEEVLRIIREEDPPTPSSRLSESQEALASIAAQRKVEPKQLSKLVRGDLDCIALKALEKDRSRRYGTATDFARDIERYLADDPIDARPPSAAYKFAKFARKHRRGIALASCFLLLLATAAIVSTWQALRAMRAEGRALAAVKTEREATKRARTATEMAKQSASAEKKAREAEAAQRKQAEAIAEVLESFFYELNPEEATKDLRASLEQRLDEVAASLETQYEGEPLLRAHLRCVLAETFTGLAHYDKAAQLLETSLTELRPNVKSDEEVLLRTLRALAEAYNHDWQLVRANSVIDEALKHHEIKLGRKHKDTLELLHISAAVLVKARRISRAVDVAEDLHNRATSTFGETDPLTLKAMNTLGTTYAAAGRFSDAITIQRKVLDLTSEQLGIEHPHTITSMANLSAMYLEAGRIDEGISLSTECLNRRKVIYGPEHPRTLHSMLLLAFAYQQAGRLEESIELLENALRLARRHFGMKHHGTLPYMMRLADLYRSAGRIGEAIELFERTVELAGDHPEKADFMGNLAIAYRHAGKIEESVAMHERVVHEFGVRLGRDHPKTLMRMHNLGVAYLDANRVEEAIALHENCLKTMTEVLGAEHPDTVMVMQSLAAGYDRVGRVDEAVALSEDALRLRKVVLGPSHPYTIQSIQSVASCYERTGRITEALTLAKEALELSQATLGAEHPITISLFETLGYIYQSAGNVRDAIPLLEQALKLSRLKIGPEHLDTLGTMQFLATAYIETNRSAEGLALIDEYVSISRAQLGAENPELASVLAQLSRDLIANKQFSAAEKYLRECLAIREKSLLDNWLVFNTMSMLGSALAGQQRFGDAEPMLIEGYEGLQECVEQIPDKARISEAVERLVDLYTRCNKPEEAAKWRERLEALEAAEAAPAMP